MVTIAGSLVSSARRSRGLSGRALARASSSSQAGLVDLEKGAADATVDRLDRVLRPLGYQVTTLPTRLGTAAAAGEEVREYLGLPNEDAALRVVYQLADDLGRADPALRVGLCVSPPAPTGQARFDALLAAVVDHVLTSTGLPLPTWVTEPSRTLDQPWDVEPVPALQRAARRRTSAAMRRHGVYLDPSELVNT